MRAALFFLAMAQLALVALSILRETPDFWRNQGGYSEAFRDFVRLGFWPLWVSFLLTQLACLTRLGRSRTRWFFWLAGLTLALVALWGSIIDNLENCLEGRPLF